jgi:hypothetical protein
MTTFLELFLEPHYLLNLETIPVFCLNVMFRVSKSARSRVRCYLHVSSFSSMKDRLIVIYTVERAALFWYERSQWLQKRCSTPQSIDMTLLEN